MNFDPCWHYKMWCSWMTFDPCYDIKFGAVEWPLTPGSPFTSSLLFAPDQHTVWFSLKVVVGRVIVLEGVHNLHMICPVGHEHWPVGQLTEYTSPLRYTKAYFHAWGFNSSPIPTHHSLLHPLTPVDLPPHHSTPSPLHPSPSSPVHEGILFFAAGSSEPLTDINCIRHTISSTVCVAPPPTIIRPQILHTWKTNR